MEETKKITIEISGMSCPACAETIQNGLSNAEGVTESEVIFETRKAAVVSSISLEEISKIVEGLGYGVIKE
ncbi:MAG: heavy-metal-associated domain-containing protein [Candidatus Scalindua sp.]|jgi:copper chaperone CopZ|nr:heavy-metal-associated domain-containing protein [Candidatus Scalindua sp.]MBT5306228.1 heavy-metal-associated domain-containing protein [Candidatus Scalindua sp.]MBT6562378.1 heavy-metal-associated domain-containing protein [Candidatus Scalindua sp.]MBT7209962.1 heavy-metal-associated domain-containing protein [Candidatus Scalindua sp.]MBT7589824.1 heavy-metal-associated domain-containing protein [Candidatus Scalindua sp.]